MNHVNVQMDEEHFKHMVKMAFHEVLDERRDFFVEIVREAFEDIALLRAMEEAADSPIVDRSEIQGIFDEARE